MEFVQHSRSCGFVTIRCPRSLHCSSFLRCDLEVHDSKCRFHKRANPLLASQARLIPAPRCSEEACPTTGSRDMLDTHEQECCRLRASIMDFELEQGEKDDVIRDLQAQLKADKDSRSAAEASFDARLKKQKDATSAAKKERKGEERTRGAACEARQIERQGRGRTWCGISTLGRWAC